MSFLLALGAVMAILLALVSLYAQVFTHRAEKEFPPEGFFLQTPLGEVHMLTFGRKGGVPVVLLHGAASSARDMRLAFQDVAARYGLWVFAPDRPGLGYTQAFEATANDRLERHAAAAMAVIDTLQLDRPIVVGHSYGGSIALRLAIDHGDRLGGLVLVAAPSTAHVGPASWYNYAASWPVIGRLIRWLVPVIGPSMLEEGLAKTFHPQKPPGDYARQAGLPRLFRPRSFHANALDLSRVNRELSRLQPLYQDITLPVALIAAPDDQVVYTECHAETLARALLDARLAIVPGGGHMPHFHAPELVAEHAIALHHQTR